MKKRVTSLLLAFCMLFSMAAQNGGSVRAAENPPASVAVTCEGAEITDIIVPQNDKKTVTAAVYAGDAYDCQWQVLLDLKSDLWVDITGQNGASLDLSYALLSSVLDASGSAYVRCAVTAGEETLYSAPVCATISYTPDVTFAPTIPEPPVRRPNYAPRAEGDSEYVYITVNYIDAVSGNQLFGSHTSKIEYGTAFNESVHSPTLLGFAPYYYKNEWDRNQNSINTDITKPDNTDNPEHEETTAQTAATLEFAKLLNGKPVNQNITVNVFYWAIDVPYAVKYFFQNINDDYYTEQTALYYVSKAKTGTIISDEELKNHAKNPEGFSALYHYPEAVAADGSTVFECYYDRNYHYIKFDLDGGYGTDPIYARYDTPIVINTPTRPGYEFLGWDELTINGDGTPGQGDSIPETNIPARIGTENKYYRALWEKAETTYTVIYWLENANDDGYSYLGYNIYPAKAEEEKKVNTDLSDAIGVKEDPARLATLRFFELNNEKSHKTVNVKGDGSTVANVYYDRKEYTLKFYYARAYTNRGTVHCQICGNTSDFSDRDREGNGTTDISTLFSYVNGNWSDVTAIPTLKNDSGYKIGTESIRHNNTDYTYYYFSITDKYGADLTDEWPIEVFNTANLSQNINGTRNAYFSAWNPEHHIYYGQHAQQEFNGNRTIKGKFQKLDRRILYDSRFNADSNNGEVRFLAFWTNALSNQTWTKSRKWIYNIYLEAVDGNMPTTPTYTVTTYDTNEAPSEQTVPSIVGFTHTKTTSRLNIDTFDSNCKVHEMNFYYERTKFALDFYNNGEVMKDQHYDIPYEDKIGERLMGLVQSGKAQPPYPENLEKNAYYFEGWYTTADCAEGSGYIRRYTQDGEWKQGKAYYNEMDANKLILYAHWVPVQHKVRFFKNYEDCLRYQDIHDEDLVFTTTTDGNQHDKVFSLPHGNVIGTIDFPEPEEDHLRFVGWFYMNNGVKTMFTPADTQVKKDLLIFADWKSENPQPYRIEYRKLSEPHDEVAAPTIGYAYQGSTRTFIPKAGGHLNQLYEDYNTGWYPTVASHSITIQPETDKDNPAVNVYTFYYVEVKSLPYTVRYVDKQTGKELSHTVTRENNNPVLSVVTERFEPIEGYVPDAFYKMLVLSVETDANGQPIIDPTKNVITFYYTLSETTAFYAIHYMLQKPGTTGVNSDDYVESDTHTEGVADFGKKITVTPPIFAGYSMTNEAVLVHVGDNTKPEHPTPDTNGKFTFIVNQNGSELYVYYTLKKYPYTVQYLEFGTNNVVAESKMGEEKQFGAVVEENAIQVDGYTALDPTTKSLTIRDYEEDSGKDDPNVITFYYLKLSYTAEYIAVGGGKLDNNSETAKGSADFKGSVPTPNDGFAFVGWYTNEECTNPVPDGWVNSDDNRLIPQVGDELKPLPTVNYYYAKFVELKGDFTISRTNAEDEGNGEQIFVYKVTNTINSDLTIYVTVTGNESKTIHGLRYGTYTVTQINDWSWRYQDTAQEVVHGDTTTAGSTTKVTFDAAANKKQWLNGNSAVVKNKKEEAKR